jgi:hypothetical protein
VKGEVVKQVFVANGTAEPKYGAKRKKGEAVGFALLLGKFDSQVHL